MTSTESRAVPMVTSDDRVAAQERLRGSQRGVIPFSIALLVVVQAIAALTVTRIWPELGGLELVAAVTGLLVAILTPLTIMVAEVAKRRGMQELVESIARERQMAVESRRREFETRLANALEMADTEPETMAAAGRAVHGIAPDRRVEILLADNSHAHLERALVRGPASESAGCSVESPDRCVAARRGQTQVFPDSDDLDACPKLQDREYGRCAAACIPVSIMGRTVGVVHVTSPVPATVDDATVRQFEVLASQVGARLGMIRVMSEHQVQASTDSLTGLPNRRSYESRVRLLRRSATPFALIMADLDNFKSVNDTHGHEAGDRALRVFSNVVRAALRPVDIACRYGGEEFTIVLPECTVTDALAVCERLRESLALTAQSGGTPNFTVSFGVTASSDAATLEEITAQADAALYEAKRSGRNRAVVSSAA